MLGANKSSTVFQCHHQEGKLKRKVIYEAQNKCVGFILLYHDAKSHCYICPPTLFFFATFFPRNAPCPPASWVDSGSVHPWHCVWVSHAAVPGPDRVCCQREQRSCGPSGRGESGRPSQRDGVGSGETQKKLPGVDSRATHVWSAKGAKNYQDSVLDWSVNKQSRGENQVWSFIFSCFKARNLTSQFSATKDFIWLCGWRLRWAMIGPLQHPSTCWFAHCC